MTQSLGFHQHLAAWCSVAALLCCRTAGAEPLGLSWDAPPECPQVEAAAASVRRLVGAEPSQSLAASVTIRQTATHRWSATLWLGARTRVVEGETCSSVVEAAVVILALAIDPKARVESASEVETAEPKPDLGPSSSPNEVQGPAPPIVAPPAGEYVRPAPAEEARSVKALSWGASLRTLGEWGILPGPSVGGVVALHGAWSDKLVELSGLGLLPREAVLPNTTDGGEFSWIGVQLMGCTALALPTFLCVGFEGGRISGTGMGVGHPRVGHAFWAAPGLELLVAPPIASSLCFEASAGIFPALLKPEFALDDLGVVHQPGPVSARVELGLGWH